MTAAPFVSRLMRHTAVYWSPVSVSADAFGGVPFERPVTIKCRWQVDLQIFRDAEGRETVTTAVVYCDRVVAIGGFLFLIEPLTIPPTKSLAEVEVDPRNLSGAYEIRRVIRSQAARGERELIKILL
jgi:hypothetical protein